MQRVEGTISDMGQTMDNVFRLLKNIDEKIDRFSSNNNRATKSMMSQMNVKFSPVEEEIP
jgi:hypothetical protein